MGLWSRMVRLENTRAFREVAAVGELLTQLQPLVESVNRAQVALIYDLQNEWALELAQLPRSVDKNYQKRCMAHYQPFWQQGISVDIINSTFADLSNYKLIVAPMLYLLQEGVAERLTAFVRAGGTLVTTYLTGIVNQSDLVFLEGAPGPLTELLGIWVEETDVLFDHHQQTIQFTGDSFPPMPVTAGVGYPVQQYADLVHLRDAEGLAHYGHDFYAGSPAVTVNHFGKGRAYYLAARSDAMFLMDFYGRLTGMIGLDRAISGPLPRGLTAQVRVSETEKAIFLLNFESRPQTVTIDVPSTVDARTGRPVSGEITLTGYGVLVLMQSVSE